MKLIIRYISLLVSGGLILPVCMNLNNDTGRIQPVSAFHSSLAKKEITGDYFYEDVIEKILPALKK